MLWSAKPTTSWDKLRILFHSLVSFPVMFALVKPRMNFEQRVHLLWSCSCYPFLGCSLKSIWHYGAQIRQCFLAYPNDPQRYMGEELDNALAKIHKRGTEFTTNEQMSS